jgi:hypothetical protein
LACREGYLLGVGIRHLIVLAGVSRLRTAFLEYSLPPRRPVH